MLQGAANHTRHGRYGFQDYCAMAITMGEKRIGKVPQ
jgi:hypothetical protein